MHTSMCWNSIEAGSLPIESVDYYLMSWEQGINEQLRIIQNGMRNLKALPWPNAREDRYIAKSALQNLITTLRTISQRKNMFAVRSVSARTIRRRL